MNIPGTLGFMEILHSHIASDTLFIFGNQVFHLLGKGVASCKEPDLHMIRAIKLPGWNCPTPLDGGKMKWNKKVCSIMD